MNAFSTKDSTRLKGVAITLMMIFHCLSTPDRIGGYPVDFAPLTEATAFKLFSYFKICVTIFAFITGYGLYLSYHSKMRNPDQTPKWTLQRYIKTYSGFMFVYVLSFIVMAVLTGKPQDVYFVSGKIRAVIYIIIDACGLAFMFHTPTIMTGWWYMSAVAVFIAIVPIICELDRKMGMLPVIACVIAIPRIFDIGFLGASRAYTFIPAVIMGMVFAKHDVFNRLARVKLFENKALDTIVQAVLYAILLAACFVLFIRLPRELLWEYTYALSAIGCILFCWKCLMPLPVVGSVLEFLGKHSMNIYFIHSFIRTGLKSYIYSSGSMFLIPLTLLLASLALSIVIESLKKLVHFSQGRDWLLAKVS